MPTFSRLLNTFAVLIFSFAAELLAAIDDCLIL